MNRKKVYRIYKEEGLSVRIKKRHRIGAKLRVPLSLPKTVNEIWTMDFVHDKLADGRKIWMLTLADKLSRKCLDIRVEYRLGSDHIVEALEKLRVERGCPQVICVDNGSELDRLPKN